mgnify:CR=1 FL=1
MTMTAEQLAQLREIANNATPGEWRYLKTTPFMDAEISAANHSRIINLLGGDVTAANSEFIAAFNPTVALALLDELERKDKRIAEQDKRLVDYAAIATKSAVRVAELEKKSAFLKEKLAQLANFNPDWDMLEATTDSLREHMSELTAANKRIAELEEQLRREQDYYLSVDMERMELWKKLEARTVTVKLPQPIRATALGRDFSALQYSETVKLLRDAGINLTVEG